MLDKNDFKKTSYRMCNKCRTETIHKGEIIYYKTNPIDNKPQAVKKYTCLDCGLATTFESKKPIIKIERTENVRQMIAYLQKIGYTHQSYGWFFKDPTVNGYRVKINQPEEADRKVAKQELELILSNGGFDYEVRYMGIGRGGVKNAFLCVIVPYAY